MRKPIFSILMLIITMGLGIALAWALVPPPPVNQLLGTLDTEYPNLVEQDCRYCHEHPETFPVEDETIPNRHHLLVGRPIPPGTEVPNPDSDGDGVPDTKYDCLTCHDLVWDEPTGTYVFADFRDCMTSDCHFRPEGEPSVHHVTEAAQNTNCDFCHGSVVDNPNDGHYIPSGELPPDLPSIECKLWEGEPGASACLAGGCLACHDEDPTADPPIAGYGDVHHFQNFSCDVCHQVHFGLNFRDCEGCHGIDSLHSIQADSNGDGVIIPGGEDPGWGHIGNEIDCEGCHYVPAPVATTLSVAATAAATTPAAPLSGPTVPYISSLSATYVTAGESTVLTIGGVSFLNTMTDPSTGDVVTFTSDVTLDGDSVSLRLTPDALTESQILVTIPATLPIGNYDLRVVKDDKQSNKTSLSIIPGVVINNLKLKRGVLTITGSGFGEILINVESALGVYILDRQGAVKCKVDLISWNDAEIVAQAQCTNKSDTVRVASLFGSAEASLGDKSRGGKPRGKK